MLERSNQQRSFRSRSRNPNATNLVTNFRTAERTVSVSLGKPLTEPRSTSQRVNESTSQRVNESTETSLSPIHVFSVSLGPANYGLKMPSTYERAPG